jgi:hypothetical protein
VTGERESPGGQGQGYRRSLADQSSSISIGQPAALVNAAVAYAARGWPILPLHWPVDGRCSCGKADCQSPGKHPLTAHGKDDATTDADTIRWWWKRWPRANVGIATGNGLLVVDVDPRNGGDESQRDLGQLPPTVTGLTGGGGQHLLFAVSEDYPSRTTALGPGLDVKCGGGYIVAPPSKHVSGGVYTWEIGHGPDEIALAPLPPTIAARLKESERTPAGEVGESIAEGHRHDALVSLAGTMRRRGMTADEIAAALLAVNEGRCVPPLPEREVEAIAASVSRYPPADGEAAPGPEKEPPDLAALLGDVVAFIRRYVVLSDAQGDVVAIWIVHTWALDAAETTPYLSITSPEKRSGKSLLLEVLSLLAARPWLTSRVSAAVLIRKVAGRRPALLLDESDAAFKGEKDYAEALRAVLNAGHRRGGVASLCEKKGANFELVDFPVFGPKAIAGIGRLPDTVADRSIPIRMKRRAPNETVARFRWREARQEAEPIAEGLRLWAAANVRLLQDARPDIPPQLDDRAADGWEPLLAIADAAGGDWPVRARRAALALSVGDGQDNDSLGVRLLGDIRAVFEDKHTDRMASADLVDALVAMEEAAWDDLRGKPLDVRTLARLLRPYGVKPGTIRIGEATPKGYSRGDFADAWSRYCIPAGTATSATTATKCPPESNLRGRNVADVADVAPNSGIRTTCPHRPPGEVEDRWAHGDGGPNPHACACCGTRVQPDLWAGGLCPVCRDGRPVKEGSGHLVRLALDMGARELKP